MIQCTVDHYAHGVHVNLQIQGPRKLKQYENLFSTGVEKKNMKFWIFENYTCTYIVYPLAVPSLL